MPNHVHLIVTPATPEGLGRALGKAHRRHSAFVNARNRVTGHLFQARFSSVAFSQVADLGNDALPRGELCPFSSAIATYAFVSALRLG